MVYMHAPNLQREQNLHPAQPSGSGRRVHQQTKLTALCHVIDQEQRCLIRTLPGGGSRLSHAWMAHPFSVETTKQTLSQR